MPMKRPCDLPLHRTVVLHELRASNKVVELTLRIQARHAVESNERRRSYEELMELDVFMSAAEFLAQHKTDRPDVSQIKVATGDIVWRVLNSDAAEAGWGPFLYDIAMELATIAGKGLCSHDTQVSEDALRVWKYYQSRRDDVTKARRPQLR